MIIKFVEVYESTRSHSNDKVRSYSLREVFVNPEQVVCVRTDDSLKRKLVEGKMPEGLDDRQEFSRIYLNRGQAGLDLVVVGSATTIEQKLNISQKQLLKG